MVIAEQCLQRGKAASAPQTTPPVRGLGMHEQLEGDTARTADPTDPRDILYYMVPCSAVNQGRNGQGATAGPWLSNGQLLLSNHFHFHYLSSLDFISLSLSFSL